MDIVKTALLVLIPSQGNATTNGPPIVLLAPYGDAAETSTLPEFEEPESGNRECAARAQPSMC